MAGTTGPAIVLVHGFGVASFQYQALMDQLSQVSLLISLLLLALLAQKIASWVGHVFSKASWRSPDAMKASSPSAIISAGAASALEPCPADLMS